MDTQPNVGDDLIRIHKVITRALNISLQTAQDGSLPAANHPGFVSYVRALAILLNSHHLGEDELAFPFWKIRFPSGPFDELIRQHGRMISHIENIQSWTETGQDVWEADALKGLQRTLSNLRAVWVSHIALEEHTIGPEKSRQYLSPSDNELLAKQLSDHGQAHSQPSELVMPFIVYNLLVPDRTEFVRLLPPVVSGQLIPGAWKPVWEPMTPFLLME
jgi:hypothetical protein